ncbi:MAG: hypothetical protein ACM36C_10760, partial [Acidobacteriota bacterium]
MRRRLTNVARSLGLVSVLALSACASVPSGRLAVDRMDYGQVIAESWKRQTLLNVVRMRYADAPVFLDVTSVINSYSLAGNVSAGGSVTNGLAGDTLQVGAGGSWSNTPTVTYQPLMGDRFTRSLLQPIPPAAVFQLMQGGWPTDLVMKTTVKSINGVRNDTFGIGGDAAFRELLDAVSRLQRAGGLGNRIETRKDGSALILVLQGQREDAAAQDVSRVRELLRLEQGLTEVEVVYGLAPRSGREVAMITRSMLEIMLEMGLGVDLPATHESTGRALPGRGQAGDAPVTPLVRIRSGNAMPADAFVGASYRGQSYWIDDTD